jgi:hypothetical protein
MIINSQRDESNKKSSQDWDRVDRSDAVGERLGAGCLAIPFGLIAFWMEWIVSKFANGKSWIDFIIRIVVGELTLAVGFLGLTFIVWALFAPNWIPRMFASATKSVMRAIALFFLIVIAPGLLFVFVYFVLWSFGIVM